MTDIPALHVGRGTPVGPVTLFPVWADVRPVRGLITGAAAPIEVGEIGPAGDVGRLSVRNLGRRPVLLLEGELLEGGKQTRACLQDVIVAPGERLDLPVVCVEQGRWGGSGSHVRRSRRTPVSVQASLRVGGARQMAVWDGVRRYESATGPTGSGSLADHLDRVGTAARPAVLPGQNGVMVGIGGRPSALELFGSRSALAAHLAGIVDAALLEAALHDEPQPVPARRARRFAAALQAVRPQPTSLDGDRWAARTDALSLRALTVGSRLAHLSAVAA